MSADNNVREIHRAALDLMRRQAREDRPLHARLKEAVSRVAMLSTVRAQTFEAFVTGDPETETPGPPEAPQFEIDRYLAPIRYAVERLEEAIDDELGLTQGREHATKTGDDLDQELAENWVGVASFVVAVRAPWLGKTPRTIERARQRMGVRQSDGRPLTPKDQRGLKAA